MGSVGRQLALYGSGRDDTLYQTPFPSDAKSAEANEIARFLFRVGKYSKLPAIENLETTDTVVELSKLSNNQETVEKKKVDALRKLSASAINDINDTLTSSGIPLVIKYKNMYQIQDGHHRLSALYAKGVKKARVRILDLEKLKVK